MSRGLCGRCPTWHRAGEPCPPGFPGAKTAGGDVCPREVLVGLGLAVAGAVGAAGVGCGVLAVAAGQPGYALLGLLTAVLAWLAVVQLLTQVPPPD